MRKTRRKLRKGERAMPKVTYDLVARAANHCWSNKFLDVFRDFFADNAYIFKDAPQIMGEQDMEQYAVYQRYLRLYEDHLSTYIESLDVSIEEFYGMLADIKDDPKIVDKKLLHFVNYLLASTDYTAFYKVMVRAAKKAEKKSEAKSPGKHLGEADDKISASPSAADAKESKHSSDEKGEK